jgi:4-hydroxy-tetrahydrodipicolinate synthase
MDEMGRLLTAMVTPFTADGRINLDAAQQLARGLCDDCSDGVVVAGTTGESPTLSDDEKIELVRRVREAIPDRNLVAGTGGNDTRHSVEVSERAMEAGANALLCVVPYYNKPPQEGMYRHFRELAGVGPVIMYNIHGRTGINMTAATTLRAAGERNVIGVKEASGDMDQMGLVCAGSPPRLPGLGRRRRLHAATAGSRRLRRHLRRVPSRRKSGEDDDRGLRGRTHRGCPRHPSAPAAGDQGADDHGLQPDPCQSALNALGFPAGPFRLPLAPLPQADREGLMRIVREAGELVSTP